MFFPMKLSNYFQPVRMVDFITWLIAISWMALQFSETFKRCRSRTTLKSKLRS